MHLSNPKVSVVLPTYNRANTILRAITSEKLAGRIFTSEQVEQMIEVALRN